MAADGRSTRTKQPPQPPHWQWSVPPNELKLAAPMPPPPPPPPATPVLPSFRHRLTETVWLAVQVEAAVAELEATTAGHTKAASEAAIPKLAAVRHKTTSAAAAAAACRPLPPPPVRVARAPVGSFSRRWLPHRRARGGGRAGRRPAGFVPSTAARAGEVPGGGGGGRRRAGQRSSRLTSFLTAASALALSRSLLLSLALLISLSRTSTLS